jgi:hypothetical protein
MSSFFALMFIMSGVGLWFGVHLVLDFRHGCLTKYHFMPPVEAALICKVKQVPVGECMVFPCLRPPVFFACGRPDASLSHYLCTAVAVCALRPASSTMSVFFSVILAGVGLGQAGPIVGVFSTALSAAYRVFQVRCCSPATPHPGVPPSSCCSPRMACGRASGPLTFGSLTLVKSHTRSLTRCRASTPSPTLG